MPVNRMSMRTPLWVAAGSVLACGLAWLSCGVYIYWNNPKLINFLAAWIPFVLSLLLAFVPEREMNTRKRIIWRSSVVGIGFIWSVVLWHQQVIVDESARQDQIKIVTTAVTQSNQHSDLQIGMVRSDLQGVKNDVQDVKKDLEVEISDTISKSTSRISESIGKVNKPIPPELATLQLSLYGEGIAIGSPLLSSSINRDRDGNVPVDITLSNTSDTTAENIDTWIYVCDSCSFASEPIGFDSPKGLNIHARHKQIAVINPGTSLEKTTILVTVPQRIPAFDVAFRYSCKVCGKLSKPQTIKIFVLPTI